MALGEEGLACGVTLAVRDTAAIGAHGEQNVVARQFVVMPMEQRELTPGHAALAGGRRRARHGAGVWRDRDECVGVVGGVPAHWCLHESSMTPATDNVTPRASGAEPPWAELGAVGQSHTLPNRTEIDPAP